MSPQSRRCYRVWLICSDSASQLLDKFTIPIEHVESQSAFMSHHFFLFHTHSCCCKTTIIIHYQHFTWWNPPVLHSKPNLRISECVQTMVSHPLPVTMLRLTPVDTSFPEPSEGSRLRSTDAKYSQRAVAATRSISSWHRAPGQSMVGLGGPWENWHFIGENRLTFTESSRNRDIDPKLSKNSIVMHG